MNMKRKIFAGLCAFSMAIGAKGGSEKVAAAPIDKVRYGAQAIFHALESLASGLGCIACIRDMKAGRGYWYNGDGKIKGDCGISRFQKIGSHFALVHGLFGIYQSLKNYFKSEPNPRKVNKDGSESKDSTVSNSNIVGNSSKGLDNLLSAARLVLDTGVFLGFASVFKGVYDSTGKSDIKGELALVYSAALIPAVSGFYSLCSDGFDLLKLELEKRNIKSRDVSTGKSEKNLKDKK